jgi:hypothetical protein
VPQAPAAAAWWSDRPPACPCAWAPSVCQAGSVLAAWRWATAACSADCARHCCVSRCTHPEPASGTRGDHTSSTHAPQRLSSGRRCARCCERLAVAAVRGLYPQARRVLPAHVSSGI